MRYDKEHLSWLWSKMAREMVKVELRASGALLILLLSVSEIIVKGHRLPMKRTLKKALRFFGDEIHRNKSVSAEMPADAPVGSVAQEQLPLYPADFSDFAREVIARVKPYTMTSPERIASLVNACEYVKRNKIQGDFVECGVSGEAVVRWL